MPNEYQHLDSLNVPNKSSWFSSGWKSLSTKVIRYSNVTRKGLTILGDVTLLVGELLTTGIRQKVIQPSLMLLSFVGLISTPYQFHLIKKTSKDFIFANNRENKRNKLAMFFAGLKVIELTSTMGLMLADIVASIKGYMGEYDEQASIYNNMIVISWANIGLTLLDDFIYIYMNRHTLKILKILQKEESTTYLVLDTLMNKNINYKYLAANVRFCMDKDTLGQLRDQLRKELLNEESTKKELMGTILKNIETQQKLDCCKATLVIISCIALSISKYYTPNSWQSASIELAYALSYGINDGVATIREVRQRKLITETTPQKSEPPNQLYVGEKPSSFFSNQPIVQPPPVISYQSEIANTV